MWHLMTVCAQLGRRPSGEKEAWVPGATAFILHHRKHCLCCCPCQVCRFRVSPSHQMFMARLQQGYKCEYLCAPIVRHSGWLTPLACDSSHVTFINVSPRGPCEALGTYTFPSPASPTTLIKRILMSSPSPPALQQLHRLNRSLSGFHDQLGSILYGEEYKRCVPNLQGCDLVWLVDYLDKVHRHVVLPHSPLNPA